MRSVNTGADIICVWLHEKNMKKKMYLVYLRDLKLKHKNEKKKAMDHLLHWMMGRPSNQMRASSVLV